MSICHSSLGRHDYEIFNRLEIQKYVREYDFLPLARKFGDKYGKKINGKNAAKTATKRVVQKTAEETGDLIRNKMADKIT